MTARGRSVGGHHLVKRLFGNRGYRDLEWQDQALCIGRYREFFVERNSDNRKGGLLPLERKAKALCARCPVREPCLEMGLTDEDGIWGGTTPGERQRGKRYPENLRVHMLLREMDDQAERLGLVDKEEVA